MLHIAAGESYLAPDSPWQPSSPWWEVSRPPLLPPRCCWCWASWAVCSNSCRGRCWGRPGSPWGGSPPARAERLRERRRPERRTPRGEDWKKRNTEGRGYEHQLRQQEKEKTYNGMFERRVSDVFFFFYKSRVTKQRFSLRQKAHHGHGNSGMIKVLWACADTR